MALITTPTPNMPQFHENNPIYSDQVLTPVPKQVFSTKIRSIAFAIPNAAQTLIKKMLTGPNEISQYNHLTLGFPGVGSPGWSLDPIFDHLNNVSPQNDRAVTWGRHINMGPTRLHYDFVDELIHRLCDATGSPITGVGHSLGALFHLHFARIYPEYYDQVIGLAGPCDLTLEDANTMTRPAISFTFKAMEKLRFIFEQELIGGWTRQSDLPPLEVPCTMIVAGLDDTADPKKCLLPDSKEYKNLIFGDLGHSDVLTDTDVHETVHLLRLHGNGEQFDANLPSNIVNRLISSDQLPDFECPSTSISEIVRGVGNVASSIVGEQVEKVTSRINLLSSKLPFFQKMTPNSSPLYPNEQLEVQNDHQLAIPSLIRAFQ